MSNLAAIFNNLLRHEISHDLNQDIKMIHIKCQVSFSPKINKDVTNVLSVAVVISILRVNSEI